MSDEARDVVRRIEVLLDTNTVPSGTDPATLAVKFAGLCAEVNRRLRECGEFIARESCANAVQMADRQPKLLEVVACLEFPQADQWRSVCRSKGWQIAEAVDKRAVDELRGACAKHASAESFLAGFTAAVHRQDHRAAVLNLRNLRRRDPQNERWQRQLRAFEESRLQQIEHLVEHHAERHDLDALEHLDAELQAEWMSPVEAHRVQTRAQACIREEKGRHSYKQATEIVERMGNAHGAKDMAVLGDCLSEYEKWLQESHLESSAAMKEVYANARAFFDETRHREETLVQFDHLIGLIRHELLDRLEPDPKLLDYVQELRQFPQHSIPDDVQARLPVALRNIHEAKRAEQRHQTVRTVLKCLAVLAAIGAVGGMVVYKKGTRDWARRVEQALGERNPDQAGKLLQQVRTEHPVLWPAPVFPALAQRLADLNTEISETRLDADKLVRQLEVLRDGGWKGDEDRIRKVLAAAEGCVATCGGDLLKAQKAALETLLSGLRTEVTRRQSERDKAFSDDVATVRKKVGAIGVEALSAEALKEALVQADELGAEIARLRGRPEVSPELTPVVDTVQARLKQQRQAVEERLEKVKALAAAADLTAYLEALEAYAVSCPDQAVRMEIDKVVAGRRDYLLVGAFTGLPIDPIGPEKAAEALAGLVEQVGDENYFWTDLVKLYQVRVQADGKPPPAPALRAAVSRRARDEYLGRLWKITVQQGRKIAAVNGVEVAELDPARQDGYLRWSDDTDMAQWWNTTKREISVVGDGKAMGCWLQKGSYYIPSEEDNGAPNFVAVSAAAEPAKLPFAVSVEALPHCTFLRRMASELPEQDEDLPEYLVTKIRQLIDDTGICPYLRTRLLGEFIEDFASLVAELPAPIAKLQQDIVANGTEVNWLCSQSPDYIEAREKSTRLLTAQKFAVEAVVLEYKRRTALLDVALSRGVVWVGYVSTDGQSQLLLPGRSPVEVWVLRPSREGGRMQVVNIGVPGDGDIRATSPRYLLPGEPLFAPRDGVTTDAALKATAAKCKIDATLLQQELLVLPCWPRRPELVAPGGTTR